MEISVAKILRMRIANAELAYNKVDVHSASSGSGRSHMRSRFLCGSMTLDISSSSTIYCPIIGLRVISRVMVKIIKALSMK
jgi:hypothetical protein